MMATCSKSRVRRSVPLVVALILAAGPAAAQKIKVHNTYGSPVDTLMNTHLTTEVPPAQDFVRATSPDKTGLDYTPLTGTDPVRPKPRSPKEVEALQAELEGAGTRNEKRAKGMMPAKTATARKTKPAKTATSQAD